MPEIVQHYATNKDLVRLGPMYDSLIIGYMDDVGKYAKSRAQILHLRHCIQSSFAQAGKRIKFEGFEFRMFTLALNPLFYKNPVCFRTYLKVGYCSFTKNPQQPR